MLVVTTEVVVVVAVVIVMAVVLVVVDVVVVIVVDMFLIEDVEIAKVIEDQVLHYVKYLTRTIDSTGSNGSSSNGDRYSSTASSDRYFNM